MLIIRSENILKSGSQSVRVQEEPRASVSTAPTSLLRPEKAPGQCPWVSSKSLGLSTVIQKEQRT